MDVPTCCDSAASTQLNSSQSLHRWFNADSTLRGSKVSRFPEETHDLLTFMTLIGIFSGTIAGENFSKTRISRHLKTWTFYFGCLTWFRLQWVSINHALRVLFKDGTPTIRKVRQDRYVEVLQPGATDQGCLDARTCQRTPPQHCRPDTAAQEPTGAAKHYSHTGHVDRWIGEGEQKLLWPTRVLKI